jgi:hypothetical protein
MGQMLDAGFWILDFKRRLSLFFQHQVSSIQYLANCGINDRFHDVVIFRLRLVRVLINLFISNPWFRANVNPESMNL